MAGIIKVDRVQSDSNLAFQVGSANVAFFDATEGIKVSSITTNNIKFPATQVNAVDGNTLDDYEEGTWTPVLSTDDVAPTVAYYGQTGAYTKIGKVVYFILYISINTISGGSGSTIITLPFTSVGNSNYGYSAITGWHSSLNHGGTSFNPLVWDATSYLRLTGNTDNGGYSQTPISGVISGTEIRLSGFYFVS
jgi:hypothetical protein